MMRSRLPLLAAAAAFFAVLANPAGAIPVSEAGTAKIGKVIDMSMVKPVFKKKNRAVIAGYQVSFVTHNKASAYAGGGGGAFAKMETYLGNVDQALMQQIADEAYATFVKKLTEAGIEVVPMEKVKASANFQALETTPVSGTPYKVNFEGADLVVVPATGFPLWFNQYDGLGAAGNKGKKNLKHLGALGEEFDAAVLQPSIAIDFASADTSGGSWARKALVEIKNGMTLVPRASVFWGYVGGGVAYAKFPDGLWSPDSTGKFVDASESHNDMLVRGLGTMGIDIGPVRSKKAIVLEADPAMFKAKSLELLEGSSEIYKRAIQDVRD